MDILELFLYILDSQAKDQAQRNIDQIKQTNKDDGDNEERHQ